MSIPPSPRNLASDSASWAVNTPPRPDPPSERGRRLTGRMCAVALAMVCLTTASLPASTQTLVSCGGEGEWACNEFDPEYWAHGACDRGLIGSIDLRVDPRVKCVNNTRRVVLVDAWTDWALRNQLQLAIDEPLNWVSRLGSHNAFNNAADGYPIPNHHWSITDQLRLGSRQIGFDLHWFNRWVRLCHAPANHLGCPTSERLYAYGVKEVRNWLDAEPDQVISIDFEDRSEGMDAAVEDPLATYLGSMIFKPSMKPAGRFPTTREMLASGRRVLIVGSDQHGGEWIHNDILWFAYPSGNVLDDNDKPNLQFDPPAKVCRTGVRTNSPGFDIFSNPTLWSWIGEDAAFSPLSGRIDAQLVEDAVRCGVGVVQLDKLGAPLASGRTPSDLRHVRAIWSWQEGDMGDRGDAAVLLRGAGDRWASRSALELHAFACAPHRSESGGDPTTWADKPGSLWKVTTGVGTWFDGGRQCLEEFGEDWVFAVPVSGFQNVHLARASSPARVWLNYNDIKREGTWVINRRPRSDAGADQVLECTMPSGATTTLDGSGSSDPERDALTYLWSGASGSAAGPVVKVMAPVGTSVFRLLVDDGYSGVAIDDVAVTVSDTVAPVIHQVSAMPNEGWAPNHKMLPVTLSVAVSDVCDSNVVCSIVSVHRNESPAVRGAGRPGQPVSEITGPLTVLLNADRSGAGDGRTYTITVACGDTAGNVSSKAVRVAIPHDRRR